MKKLWWTIRSHYFCCGWHRVEYSMGSYFMKHKESRRCVAKGQCRRAIAEQKLKELNDVRKN